MALAQRGRGGVMMRGRGGTMIRGRGGVMISRGGLKRPLHTGPRPSFQVIMRTLKISRFLYHSYFT